MAWPDIGSSACGGVAAPASSVSRAGAALRQAMAVAAAGLLLSAGSPACAADEDDELYKTKNCFACHRIDRHHHAPKFKDIAAKYAGDKGAEAVLVKKVLEGGSGVWGPTPMPPQAQVTPAEATTLVRWILALKSP